MKLHPELLGKTGDELREMASESARRSRDSFDRCDTDGFLSQWASDTTARLYRHAADLADNGWTAEFDELFDAETGERLNVRLVETRYGMAFVYDTPQGAVWVSRSHASTDAKRRKHYAGKGVTLGTIRRRVVPAMDGRGTGLNGTCWPTHVPDREFPQVEVVTVDRLAEEVNA